MAKYSAIKAAVNAYIKQNGRKEITGKILNAVLNATIDSLGKFYQFAGEALPTDDPGTPDQNLTYLAGTAGTYTNFGGLTLDTQEIALLMWDGEWKKQTLLFGIQEVDASVDNQVGTPSVDVDFVNNVLTLSFHNIKGDKGDTGDPAGFGQVTASVDDTIGNPSVQVQTSGEDTAKNIAFEFHGLRGETGITSVVVSVDNTTGNPACSVSLVGQVLHLDFTGLKGLKGDTGVSADYPITIYNGLDSDATDQALAAAQGKVLDGKVSQLGQELNDIDVDLGSWELGSMNPETLTDYSSNTRIRCAAKTVTKASKYKITCNTGYYFLIYVTGKVSTITWRTSFEIDLEVGDRYRIALKTDPETNFSSYTSEQINALAESSGISVIYDYPLNERVGALEPRVGALEPVVAQNEAKVNQLGQETNELNETIGFGVDITSPNDIHVPFKFYAGKNYKIKNNSETTCQIYARITQSSTNQIFVGNVPAGGSVIFNPEVDYNYLYFYLGSGSATYSINVKYTDSILDNISLLDSNERVFASVNSLALGNNANLPFKGYLGPVGWLSRDDSSHVIIICKPGDIISITGGAAGAQFGFLRDYNLLSDDILYCEGTGRTQVSAGSTSTATAPEDVKFLAVSNLVLGQNRYPLSIKINGIEVPFAKKTVKEYLDELSEDLDEVSSDILDVHSEIISGASIILAGSSTSNLILNEPIELSQDGDEVEISVDDINANANLALAFSNSGLQSNLYYAIQLGKDAVGIRAADGTWLHQSTEIPSESSHVVKISFSNGNILTYVDGSLVNTYTGQKTIRIASFGNGGNGSYGYWAGIINYIKYNGQDINLYLQQINNATVIKQYRFAPASEEGNYPKGILKYNATNKQFDFYSRLGDSNKYFMFRVRLHTDDTDLVYLKEWRWSYGKYCEYNGSIFTNIAVTADDAENEMAMHFADTIDYTGGIHGDERIDISPDSFVKFFADGRLISDAEMTNNFTIECASFAYMQLSSLHQTSTVEGEFVAGHPIIAMHYKRNTFENCKSHLENRIIFKSEQHVTQYHAGLMCVGKGAATYALLPNAVSTPQLTGTNNLFNADNKKVSRVDMWNPTTGLRCYVEGKMIEGISESDINILQVWDRTTDSKYYRRMVVNNSNAKVFQEGDVIINKQDVVYY